MREKFKVKGTLQERRSSGWPTDLGEGESRKTPGENTNENGGKVKIL